MEQGKAQMIVELGREDGLDDATTIKRMQEKIGLSLEQIKSNVVKNGIRLCVLVMLY